MPGTAVIAHQNRPPGPGPRPLPDVAPEGARRVGDDDAVTIALTLLAS